MNKFILTLLIFVTTYYAQAQEGYPSPTDKELKPLTGIQKNLAYGIETRAIDDRTYELTIVSLPSQKFYLYLPPKGKPYVVTTVNGLKFKVNRIFIRQRDGTSGLTTKVDYILFYGTSKNKEVVEKLLID